MTFCLTTSCKFRIEDSKISIRNLQLSKSKSAENKHKVSNHCYPKGEGRKETRLHRVLRRREKVLPCQRLQGLHLRAGERHQELRSIQFGSSGLDFIELFTGVSYDFSA